jgi:hypothetical protein
VHASKWSDDAFLDSLRLLGDEPADACLAELPPVIRPELG